MDPGKIFQIITNSTLLATRLLPGAGGPVQFSEARYCSLLPEDAPIAVTVAKVTAVHKEGSRVRYRITGGNRDGLFTINRRSGLITLAAHLNYEIQPKHELVVAAEADGKMAHAIVQVSVADVNDNPPRFLETDLQVTVVEEDDTGLPATIIKVLAEDSDKVDEGSLVYSVEGDGVDGYGVREAYFTINPRTGELIQLRALDRDPPRGREVWRVKVQVKDGQRTLPSSYSSLSSAYSNQRRRYPRVPLYGYPELQTLESMEMSFPYREGPLDQSEFPKRNIQHDTDRNFEHTNSATDHFTTLQQTSKPMAANRIFVDEERKLNSISKQVEIRQTIKHNEENHLLLKKTHNTIRKESFYTDHLSTKITRNTKSLQDSNGARTFISHKGNLRSSEYASNVSQKVNRKRRNIKDKSLSGRIVSSANGSEEQSHSKETVRGIRPTLTSTDRSSASSVSLSFPIHFEEPDNEFLDAVDHDIQNEFEFLQVDQSWHANKFVKRHASTKSGECPEHGIDWAKSDNTHESDVSSGYGGRENIGNIHSSYGGHGDGYGDWNSGGDWDGGGGGHNQQRGRQDVHVAETFVTVVVKDINDNAPSFPNATIFGEVQENGPIDLSIAVVSAWDADDEKEGTNARITYAIEKNVIEERSGQAIFAVHPDTGLIRTAICCLDRETTPEYNIQVVAVDGGGLKGTGNVVVRLADVNDNSPRLNREEWNVEVDETWGHGPPDNKTLIELSTLDHDTSNYFFYRVVESSGWGWEHFGIRTQGTIGQLFANRILDYEDPAHRRGFRFMVQVTDRGRGGWSDSRHTDTAWVAVRLRDVNDNPPEFRRPHVHITIGEDTPSGTLLATFLATDLDKNGHQRVNYRVKASWGSLTIDKGGGVRLWRSLDRESPGGEKIVAKIIAIDDGVPPMSATATLSVTLKDVNDCPPRLLPPTVFHVREGTHSFRLGTLMATDDDVWALGHGPPFNLSLAPTNDKQLMKLLALRYDPTLDSGRGGAELWTLAPIDREEYRQLVAEILVSDAEGLTASQPVTVIIDDVNDNPMKPAAKTVHLWKMQGGGADADIGRVYVEDPDDWDTQDKTFSWAGVPHPLFTLNSSTGAIYASTQVREGRYDLQFRVSDRVWHQSNVSANVSVAVRYLNPEALAHAVPITLTPATPSHITSGWMPSQGGGGLGLLVAAVTSVVKEEPHYVEVVSVYGSPSSGLLDVPFRRGQFFHGRIPQHPQSSSDSFQVPSTCVWIAVRRKGGSYVDPIKLQGLLALHIQQLEDVMKLSVVLEESPGDREQGVKGSESLKGVYGVADPSSVASMASTSLRLQVVDTNSTSLVTPRLSRAVDCRANVRNLDDACTSLSCLNGGRCVRTERGKRCICPGGTWGKRCKILSRTFKGGGWVWVTNLPPCLPTTISLRVLTTEPEGLLLYSGPLASTYPRPKQPPSAMIAMQLKNGKPQVLIEGGRGPLKLEADVSLDNGDWHILHLHLNSQGVTLVVDHCQNGWEVNSTAEEATHCLSSAEWATSHPSESWISSVPLQVGGLAHRYPNPHLFGWSSGPVQQGFNGCISHLRINKQLIDLGEPAFASGSTARCTLQDKACETECGFRGQCVGGLNEPTCDCDPGWEGPKCTDATLPMTLGQDSFAQLSLNFQPHPYSLVIQMRVRIQGRSDGVLMLLKGREEMSLEVRLRGGLACTALTESSKPLNEVCLEEYSLGDGSWHSLHVSRWGYDLSIAVDDGDGGWRHNDTLISVLSSSSLGDDEGGLPEVVGAKPPVPFLLEERNQSILIGGIPQYATSNLVSVHHDLRDCCIDDLRISGKSLPLHGNSSGSEWGQLKTFQHVEEGCISPDLCANTSCLSPLSCHQTWRHATCSCGPGSHLQAGTCQDIDECSYQPCLHGGTCTNLYPGYQCSCNQGTSGNSCEWYHLRAQSSQLMPPVEIAALTLSLVVLVLMGALLTLWIHRSRSGRGGGLRQSRSGSTEADIGSVMDVVETPLSTQDAPHSVIGVIETPLSTKDAHTLKSKEEMTLLESLKLRIPRKNNTQEEKKMSISTISSPRLPEKSSKDLSVILPISSSASYTSRRCPSTGSLIGPRGHLLEGNPKGFVSSSSKSPHIAAIPGKTSTLPLLAQDDLRAYAYEGDGSPSSSLTSSVLGMRQDSLEENVIALIPDCREVLDLLKSLPDAVPPPGGMRRILESENSSQMCSGGRVTMVPSISKENIEKVQPWTNTQPPSDNMGRGSTTNSETFSGGTLPLSVRRVPLERKSSLSELSTLC